MARNKKLFPPSDVLHFCTGCDFKSNWSGGLASHVCPSNSNTKGKKSKKNPKEKKEKAEQAANFRCELCGLTFVRKDSHNVHLKQHREKSSRHEESQEQPEPTETIVKSDPVLASTVLGQQAFPNQQVQLVPQQQHQQFLTLSPVKGLPVMQQPVTILSNFPPQTPLQGFAPQQPIFINPSLQQQQQQQSIQYFVASGAPGAGETQTVLVPSTSSFINQ